VPNKLKEWARAIKRDVHAIYLAARDPRVPWYAKALALCVAGYALSPIDLIPDFVPIFGYLDDLVIVPLGIVAVVKLIPPEIMAEHRAAAAIASERPTSRMAAAVIALIWVASMALVAWVAYRYFVSASSTGLLTGMSASGTKQTSTSMLNMSAFGGKADIADRLADVC
jgi:uncharacterized membrane protein YkvA (DUF1232 family)